MTPQVTIITVSKCSTHQYVSYLYKSSLDRLQPIPCSSLLHLGMHVCTLTTVIIMSNSDLWPCLATLLSMAIEDQDVLPHAHAQEVK